MGGGSGGSPGGSMDGPSVHHPKGAQPQVFLDKARTLRRTISKSLVQPRCTLRDSLVRAFLIIVLILSTFPEDWGQYGM